MSYIKRIVADLRAGWELWGSDGPQTVTDWDECAAAWRANYRGAVDALERIGRGDVPGDGDFADCVQAFARAEAARLTRHAKAGAR